MAMNYLAILLCPFIINILKDMLHIETQQFAFIFNMAIALIAAAWAYLNKIRSCSTTASNKYNIKPKHREK